jgi:hypothetical protein
MLDRSEHARNSRMQMQETETDELIITLIDLISSRDHKELRYFLTDVLIDVTMVYDNRGFNMAHICA